MKRRIEKKFKIKLLTFLENNHKSLENRIILLETELQGMKGMVQEIEHSKQ